MKYFFFLLVLLAASPVFSADTTALLVGVLRTDGVIIPFASHDGSQWDAPWPEADTPPDTTLKTLGALPKKWFAPLDSIPHEWYVRTLTGGFHAARIDRPVVVKSRCSKVWGLTADPEKISGNAPREPQSVAVPKDGIALSRNVQVRPVVTVSRESREWNALQSVIRAAFTAEEGEKGHPFPRETREREELLFPVLSRGAEESDGSAVYYFEAVRNYVTAGLLPGVSPEGVSFFRGWLRRDRIGTLSFIRSDLSYERFFAPKEPALVPLGILNLGGNPFWVVQAQEKGSELYRILEVGRNEVRVVVEMFGGGC